MKKLDYMKHIILVSLLFCSLSLIAQQRDFDAELTAEVATTQLVDVYQLDKSQQKTMLEIQERRLRNLEEIKPLRRTAYEKYLHKRRAIEKNTLGSIERMLTAEQRPILKQQRYDRRKKESDLIKKLRAEGKSPDEIQIAILELQ